MAIKKSIIPEIIPFPVIKDFHHDEWIAIVASKKKSYELLNEKYFYYRIHDDQQVGGVFHDKVAKTKIGLTENFDLSMEDLMLSSYKKMLKKLCKSYERIKRLDEKEKEDNPLYEENYNFLRSEFNSLKKEMIAKYPVKSRVLNFTDKILNKRQLK